MKSKMWFLATLFFKIGLLVSSSWLLWIILMFVTLNVFLRLSFFNMPERHSPAHDYLLVVILGAEFMASVAFVTWAIVRFEKQPEKQKRKEKPKPSSLAPVSETV